MREGLTAQQGAIAALCHAEVRIEAGGAGETPEHSAVAVAVAEGVTLIVPLDGLVDMDKERERLQRELKKVDKDLVSLERKLGNAEFLARAPAALVEQDRERQRDLTAARDRLQAASAKLAKSG